MLLLVAIAGGCTSQTGAAVDHPSSDGRPPRVTAGGPTTRPADYLGRQAGSMLEEDADQVSPGLPKANPRRAPEPLQIKPIKPAAQLGAR